MWYMNNHILGLHCIHGPSFRNLVTLVFRGGSIQKKRSSSRFLRTVLHVWMPMGVLNVSCLPFQMQSVDTTCWLQLNPVKDHNGSKCLKYNDLIIQYMIQQRTWEEQCWVCLLCYLLCLLFSRFVLMRFLNLWSLCLLVLSLYAQKAPVELQQRSLDCFNPM